ncbi:MAG: FtsW/RodA/SpoVE family cell cycle protein, partial [Bacteroidota bacterium]
MLEHFREYFDYKAFLICVALVGLGLLSVYSATFDVGAASAFEKQVVWAGIGLLGMLVAVFF